MAEPYLERLNANASSGPAGQATRRPTCVPTFLRRCCSLRERNDLRVPDACRVRRKAARGLSNSSPSGVPWDTSPLLQGSPD